MNSLKILIVLNSIFFSLQIIAQPNTEIYLLDLKKQDNGALTLSNPVNISNNVGYDNQPLFWKDSKSILYARTIDGQTDIARYFIKSEKTVVISDTPQGGEYSPTPMADGRISGIRLDTTGLQLLYAYDLKGKNEVLVNDLVIGYHAWLSPNTMVAFVLGETATMQIINTTTGNAEIVAEDIGRSLHQIPGSENFSYLDKSVDEWTINQMNPETKETVVLTKSLAGVEDYAWTSSNQILMGKGSKLYVWEMGKEWKEIADLSEHTISNITRLSISQDGKKLALVAE